MRAGDAEGDRYLADALNPYIYRLHEQLAAGTTAVVPVQQFHRDVTCPAPHVSELRTFSMMVVIWPVWKCGRIRNKTNRRRAAVRRRVLLLQPVRRQRIQVCLTPLSSRLGITQNV